MKVQIKPGRIGGTIKAVPSKSISHRAIIAAGLADGKSHIGNIILSDDIQATCDAMESFGASINRHHNSLEIISKGHISQPSHPIDCRESGSTLRFLTPFGGIVSEPVVYRGKEGLSKRPMTPYIEIFNKQNMRCETKGGLPMVVEGMLKPGKFKMRGDVSSQFISGLLFSLPMLDGDSEIEITTPIESKGYVDLTMEILEKFGVEVGHKDHQLYKIKGNQVYKKYDMMVEGDFSQAAFWVIAGILGNGMIISGLNPESKQGDQKIIEIVTQMGAKAAFDGNNLVVSSSRTQGTVIDASQIPDLVPIITVLAALSDGKTEIINASRLRIKESDRLKSIATELNKLGAQVLEKPDGLLIFGKERLMGGIVDSWNDHRIAMSLAVASIRCEDKVTIENCEAIEKSYPDFFNDFVSLGVELVNSTWGNRIVYSLFGESHGPAIGITIHHLPPGITLDFEKIRSELDLRKPGRDEFSTPRKENDNFEIICGILDGVTTGAPMTVLIRNENQRSRDYDEIRYKMRPSHSDYAAHVKYKGYNDYRGGGHFSGRLTAPIVVAGEIANQILRKRGIVIESEIIRIGQITRETTDEKDVLTHLMKQEILEAKKDHDSVGGTIKATASGIEAGFGEPFFHSVESVLAGLFYSIPGVKGVTFGLGIQMSELKGSMVNDALKYNEHKIEHMSNNNGGINGGITNGMPVDVQIYFKPTPSIGKSQQTIDIKQQTSIEYAIDGRHDPCIVPRAMPVVRAMMAIGILELILLDHS